MPKNKILLSKDPFNQLDGYDEEAFAWAQEMTSVIDISKFAEKDPLIISVSFAYIFSVFIHVTMGYSLVDFEDYVEENVEETLFSSWDSMHTCVNEIHSALMTVYKDPMKLYLTLYDSVLIEKEDDEYEYTDGKKHIIKVEPQGYDEYKGFGYVSGGFGY